MAAPSGQQVTVDGRVLALTNLDKVLYPATGTTKGEVIAYYAEVGAVLLPHLRQRPITRKRWPDGVGLDGDHVNVFFAKNLPMGTPHWVRRYTIQHSDGTNDYPVADELATLVWLAQLAALELHVPQWRFAEDGTPLPPDRLVLDLDPGDGVTLADCAEVALWVREVLHGAGLAAFPVTSGSKGIHLYAHLDGSLSPAQASDLARELAMALQSQHPDRVTAVMRKADRGGKVFLDWSQNNGNKTTITPYSLRGRTRPTVAAPRTWEELADPELKQLELAEVLARLGDNGDLLAPLATPQTVPEERSGAERPNPSKTVPEERSGAQRPNPSKTVPEERSGAQRPNASRRAAEPIEPMLATLSIPDAVGNPDNWHFEMKWDGVRIIAYLDSGEVRLLSRRGRDETARYPDLVPELAALDCKQAVLDGEIVVLDAGGAPNFGLLQPRINLTRATDIAAAARQAPAQLMLFDLLGLDGEELVRRPYEERRELLESLQPPAGSRVQVPPVFEGDLTAALDASKAFRLEGVVAKRRGSTYEPARRGRTWLKIKHRRSQSVIVGGWRPGQGNRDGTVGALLLGVPDGDQLRYVGRVGSGFTDTGLAQARRLLDPLHRKESPLVDVPAEDARGSNWVEPTLVGEVFYTELTSTHRLRHPVWKGWRPDVPAGNVTWEVPT